ncbi:MAG: putative methyltransferase [Rhodospirillales bacterium]|nr:putative methyltransferase [Rhodospirillales bacterium]
MNDERQVGRSWDRNAGNWTRAVRDGLIPSRRAGTDEAILQAIAERGPKRLLDVGCGEGWLIRAVVGRTGCAAVGIDGAEALSAAARAADPANSYLTMDYDAFAADPSIGIGADFDVIAFNYSLFTKDIAPLLQAAASRLTPEGAIIIQTLHPGPVGEEQDGWRVEDFSVFAGEDWAAIPWYFRRLESWCVVLRDAGLDICERREPAADGRMLSLLIICAPIAC